MSGNREKKRQKKLAKKAAKRKGRKSSDRGFERRVLGRFTESLIARLPICECLVPERVYEMGMGNIIISRTFPDGNIAVGAFLVDKYCLGVKNALFAYNSPRDYEYTKEQLEQDGYYREVQPAYARKLIEGAVDYARSLGFKPHQDYRQAAVIFGDIDPGRCAESFEFGKDGKPWYISGPTDSRVRRQTILRTLEKHCGPEHYSFSIECEPDELPAYLDGEAEQANATGTAGGPVEIWEDIFFPERSDESGEDRETEKDKSSSRRYCSSRSRT